MKSSVVGLIHCSSFSSHYFTRLAMFHAIAHHHNETVDNDRSSKHCKYEESGRVKILLSSKQTEWKTTKGIRTGPHYAYLNYQGLKIVLDAMLYLVSISKVGSKSAWDCTMHTLNQVHINVRILLQPFDVYLDKHNARYHTSKQTDW